MEKSASREKKIAPGPKGRFLLGSLQDFKKDTLGFLVSASREFGDVVRFQVGPETGFILRHPDHVQHVLLDHHRNYNKQSRGFKVLRAGLGEGLVTSEGELWLRQRRLMQPAFHRERLTALTAIMAQEAEACAQRWKSLAKKETTVDVASEMMHLTLRIVSKSMFSTEISWEEKVIEKAVRVILAEMMYRIPRPYLDFLPRPGKFRFRRAMRELDNLLNGLITARRKQGPGQGDLLSMLMEAKDADTGETMNNRQLRDEAVTIFMAGHETTANALSWTFYLLSQHPEVEARLRQELAQKLGGRAPGFNDLPALTYTANVIKESLRVRPPVWSLSRMSVEDDEIGGYFIPAGSLILLSSYITHRHPDFWREPESFNPERFASETINDLPRFAYFPFGGGPRQCIGNNFALMEAQIVLAALMQQFHLELPRGQIVTPEPLITLRPKGGLPMKVRASL